MKNLAKSIVLAVWMGVNLLLQVVGKAVESTEFTIDWSQTVWAFLGSTVYMMYEIVKEIKRPPTSRALLVAMGMIVSMGFGPWVSSLSGVPIIVVTLSLGFSTFLLIDKLVIKKLENPEKAIKDFTGLNDKDRHDGI